jgi:hypothetical protein
MYRLVAGHTDLAHEVDVLARTHQTLIRDRRSAIPSCSMHESPRVLPVSTGNRAPLLAAGQSLLTFSMESTHPKDGHFLSEGGELPLGLGSFNERRH